MWDTFRVSHLLFRPFLLRWQFAMGKPVLVEDGVYLTDEKRYSVLKIISHHGPSNEPIRQHIADSKSSRATPHHKPAAQTDSQTKNTVNHLTHGLFYFCGPSAVAPYSQCKPFCLFNVQFVDLTDPITTNQN